MKHTFVGPWAFPPNMILGTRSCRYRVLRKGHTETQHLLRGPQGDVTWRWELPWQGAVWGTPLSRVACDRDVMVIHRIEAQGALLRRHTNACSTRKRALP